ncbi:MAG: transcriptional repressor [Candidatus Moranbacteria bacterium]|nr:transcriptional repressor [Candidatus Moranbacteria bacterium]
MGYEEEIFTVLKTHHLRLTKTRKALIEVFFRYEVPLSAQDISRELSKIQRAVNKTTVYRELERLREIGIIGAVQLGDRKQYYELALRRHHHHLICLRCAVVEDIDMDERALLGQEKRIQGEKHFTILRHSLEFFGLCKMCS